MTCKIANEISLEILLQSWGFKKLKSHRSGDEFFFENPIREDSAPSFSVNVKKNVWIDFLDMKGGKVVDLIMAIEKTDVKGALAWLRDNTNDIQIDDIKNRVSPVPYEKPEARFSFKKARPIFSYGLKDYLEDRGISINIAKTYLEEIRYYDREKKQEYFSLGIKNNSGGYALRNKLGKVILAPNDMKYIPSNVTTETILIFEGTFDFLSYLMIKKTSVLNDDVVILNTLAFTRKAAEMIKNLPHIQRIISFLDNPKEKSSSQEAMDRALDYLSETHRKVFLANETFKGFEDIAAYWEANRNCQDIILKEL